MNNVTAEKHFSIDIRLDVVYLETVQDPAKNHALESAIEHILEGFSTSVDNRIILPINAILMPCATV